MNRLTKEKRNQLILVILVTLAVLGGLYAGLIRYQNDYRAELGNEQRAAEKKLRGVEAAIRRADQVTNELAEASAKLAALEGGMASGDPNYWANNMIRRFKPLYKVDLPSVTPPQPADNVALLPNFPYKQDVFDMHGTAYFHDLGKFLAGFENEFPHMRVLNLEILPAASLISGEKEKLTINMQIVMLVKPSSP